MANRKMASSLLACGAVGSILLFRNAAAVASEEGLHPRARYRVEHRFPDDSDPENVSPESGPRSADEALLLDLERGPQRRRAESEGQTYRPGCFPVGQSTPDEQKYFFHSLLFR